MEGGNYFVTLQEIRAGEELTIDYNTLAIESSTNTRDGG
jgi:SET domain-containing protein